MKRKNWIVVFFALLTTWWVAQGCRSTSPLAEAKTGAQLWGENCLRCHNAPSPQTFSDTEWEVAVMHMRIRANLTEAEAVKVAEFLKTAN